MRRPGSDGLARNRDPMPWGDELGWLLGVAMPRRLRWSIFSLTSSGGSGRFRSFETLADLLRREGNAALGSSMLGWGGAGPRLLRQRLRIKRKLIDIVIILASATGDEGILILGVVDDKVGGGSSG
jgi:hypothetical protein